METGYVDHWLMGSMGRSRKAIPTWNKLSMIGNMMKELNQSAWAIQISTVGQFLELDTLHVSALKR